jgi:hypothetical protein
MPTRRAFPSASAPPELPGLSAASVWITFSTIRTVDPDRVGSDRPRAETTPAVTEPPKPCGFPIATTSCPTRNDVASPSSVATRSRASVRRTARSESGSAPTTSARKVRPSVNVAVARRARATTCAEVSRNPSAVIATALPAPLPTWRFATEGESRSATSVTTREYASSGSSGRELTSLSCLISL